MLQMKHKQEGIKILADAFMEEPLSMLCGVTYENLVATYELCWKYWMMGDLTVVAIDEESGRMAGMFGCLD